jgi:hypothetical protein
MARWCKAAALIGVSLCVLPAARAQNGPFDPGPGFLPGAGPGSPGDGAGCIPADAAYPPPGCSVALHDPPKNKPNAFFGEHQDPETPVESSLAVSAEYLNWLIRNGPLSQPLVTSSVSPGATLTPGALGQPGTVPLFGGNDLGYGSQSGARLSAVYTRNSWPFYLEVRGFILEDGSLSYTNHSDATGAPFLARPFSTDGTEMAAVISSPGLLSGALAVTSSSQFGGVEANAGFPVYSGEYAAVDVLAGFRFLDLDEDLNIYTTSTPLAAGTVNFLGATLGPGNTVNVMDVFRTHNRFYGGQVGLRSEASLWGFSVIVDTKVALGQTHQVVDVHGTSTLISPTGVTQVPGGLLALRSNSGILSNQEFSVAPELTVNVGYELTQSLRIFVGYNLLYWTNVARPGDQVNRSIDVRQVPTSPSFSATAVAVSPPQPFKQSDFWAQGVNVGIVLGF